MLDKIFWLIFAIIMAFSITRNKYLRIALISLFLGTFLDGILFNGFYSQLLILNPVIFITDLSTALVLGVYNFTYETVDFFIIGLTDLVIWTLTPLGLVCLGIALVFTVISINLFESIAKIPKGEV